MGDHVSGGDIFGTVYENSLVDNHKMMMSPRALGTVTHVAETGSYSVNVSAVTVDPNSLTPQSPKPGFLPRM